MSCAEIVFFGVIGRNLAASRANFPRPRGEIFVPVKQVRAPSRFFFFFLAAAQAHISGAMLNDQPHGSARPPLAPCVDSGFEGASDDDTMMTQFRRPFCSPCSCAPS